MGECFIVRLVRLRQQDKPLRMFRKKCILPDQLHIYHLRQLKLPPQGTFPYMYDSRCIDLD